LQFTSEIFAKTLLRAIDRSARSTDRAALSADCAAHLTDSPIEKHYIKHCFCQMPL